MSMVLVASRTKTAQRSSQSACAKKSVSPEQREEVLQLLQEEIAYIHNGEFEHLDIDTIEQLVQEAGIHRRQPSSETTIPDGLPAYLANLYTIPLLTAEGEAALFRKMNYLKYRANLCRVALDPDRPQRKLTQNLRRFLEAADGVRNLLAESNLRLVVSIARRFAGPRFSFEELVSEGNMILMKAIEKFDYSRGYRFSTYATHSVQRHFFRHFRNAKRRNTHEVAMADEYLNELSDNSEQESDKFEFSDAQVGEILAQLDEQLDEREQYIIQERFGIGPSGTARTLQSLSQELHVSKERVRQLHHKAIAKLRKGLDRLFPDMMSV
ncbi:RNA polymerase principal sigma factor HrdB [Symmachiella macrocystis]|uniref:RNA polymerase principal sigma factor HrdB n=1 Tax=Symmachiella macrocystis TaxID=2527985 RepID=A0A5C6BJA7_9PLAN|nr:sigma-70 family RNA polymerase sigma factor [Symmachiella macrocystis]TWU11792.1 RNA polymerase principal sigma factor HrdB [Symmachiella macrocystis]